MAEIMAGLYKEVVKKGENCYQIYIFIHTITEAKSRAPNILVLAPSRFSMPRTDHILMCSFYLQCPRTDHILMCSSYLQCPVQTIYSCVPPTFNAPYRPYTHVFLLPSMPRTDHILMCSSYLQCPVQTIYSCVPPTFNAPYRPYTHVFLHNTHVFLLPSMPRTDHILMCSSYLQCPVQTIYSCVPPTFNAPYRPYTHVFLLPSMPPYRPYTHVFLLPSMPRTDHILMCSSYLQCPVQTMYSCVPPTFNAPVQTIYSCVPPTFNAPYRQYTHVFLLPSMPRTDHILMCSSYLQCPRTDHILMCSSYLQCPCTDHILMCSFYLQCPRTDHILMCSSYLQCPRTDHILMCSSYLLSFQPWRDSIAEARWRDVGCHVLQALHDSIAVKRRRVEQHLSRVEGQEERTETQILD